jgi:hypothetical protein
MKLTPWFPPDVLPVYEGVYKTLLTATGGKFSVPGYSHWTPPKNGRCGRWSGQASEPSRVWRDSSGVQQKSWRGLARPAA